MAFLRLDIHTRDDDALEYLHCSHPYDEPQWNKVRLLAEKHGYEVHPHAPLAVLNRTTVSEWPYLGTVWVSHTKDQAGRSGSAVYVVPMRDAKNEGGADEM